MGHLGGSVGWVSNFSSGHDLMVHEFEPHIGICVLGSVLTSWSLEPASDSVSLSPKARGLKAKVNYRELMKIKSFCAAKGTISKAKRQLTEWEKILANDLSDRGLVSKIYKELSKLHARKTNNPVRPDQRPFTCKV